ncbi:MAG: hypothetical protein Rubg2KO_10330 [Rubricoccaceae bacterium]
MRAIIRNGPRRLGGPRTGFTILSSAVADKINETFPGSGCQDSEPCDNPRIDPSLPLISQFGWQFENRIFQAESGLTGLTEIVFLVGGAERGLLLPSATFLAGLRTPSGLEVGVGPNVSLSGAAYAFTVGMNNEFGEMNLPINIATVLGQDGPRVSLLVGFNTSERRY